MHKGLFALYSFLLWLGTALGQSSETGGQKLRNIDNDAFQVGERLEFKIRYGMVKAGIASLEVKEITTRSGHDVYRMVGKGKTVGMTDWFFRVRDRYETFVDKEALSPWEFIRDVDEGGYEIKRHLMFDLYNNTVHDQKNPNKGTFSVSDYPQDMISSFYYARTRHTEHLKPGDALDFSMFLDYEQFPFKLRYLGNEVIKTDFGKIECMKFRPSLQEGRVFEDEESMTIWISDDANKIPVLLKSELAVGSIKMELTDYANLKNPVSFR